MALTVTALGKHAATASVTTSVITTTATALVGDLVVVALTTTAGSPFTATDSAGNTWSKTTTLVSDSQGMDQVFWSVITSQIASGGTITVTGTAGWHSTIATSFRTPSGTTATVEDVETGRGVLTPGTTAVDSLATATTTNANDLVYGSVSNSSSTLLNMTPGAGFTLDPNGAIMDTTTFRTIQCEYKEVSSTGTQSTTATSNTTGSYHAMCVTFKLAAATAGGVSAALPHRMPLGV